MPKFSPIVKIQTVVANKRYDRKIKKMQKNIGPYVPVSYTQIWA